MISGDGLGLGHNPSNQSAIIGLLFRKTGPACRHFSNKFSLTSEEWSIIRLDTFPLPFFILGIYYYYNAFLFLSEFYSFY